jgi:hypothetical protein
MSELRRLALIALPCWVLWAALIGMAAPDQPSGGAQIVFLASMVAALIAAIWACWNMLPQHAGKPWRRVATIVLGVVAFAVILFIGHAFGVSLASALAA